MLKQGNNLLPNSIWKKSSLTSVVCVYIAVYKSSFEDYEYCPKNGSRCTHSQQTGTLNPSQTHVPSSRKSLIRITPRLVQSIDYYYFIIKKIIIYIF